MGWVVLQAGAAGICDGCNAGIAIGELIERREERAFTAIGGSSYTSVRRLCSRCSKRAASAIERRRLGVK